ncbi:MFS transporter [Hwanghaeella grinnelliae]|uniref:MFS transporter n=1 Tax=Hwanghaeella grinnelliae TaxID=2500179 RepID=A0A3S2W801_9PROT|nr:MFS transporter [Hwanghaeella grinnelliae]RVU35011.1 MFS transporter [Hwanghaeella grinnelliae]
MSKKTVSERFGTAGPSGNVTILRAVLTVFVPFAGAFFLSYLFRSINAVIAPQLVSEVGLTAADLGLLTSAFFLTFAAFQIPLGLLLDRFGPRRVQSVLLVSAAAGAVVFSFGQSIELLLVGRALIGFGLAGGLMSSFKAITLWFPRESWAMVNGCFLGMGGLGAIAATVPTEALLQYMDWRGIFLMLAGVTVLSAGVIAVIVPERATEVSTQTIKDQLRGLGQVYRDPLFWRIAPVAAASLSNSMAIQSLWAGPWLRDVAGFDRGAVAEGLLGLTMAMTAGFFLTGTIVDFLRRWGITTVQVLTVIVPVLFVSQFCVVLELMPQSILPWLLFGLTGNVCNLAYAHMSRHFPIELAGRANSALNLMTFSSVFLTQYGIGVIIDQWPVTELGGYAPQAYQAAFGFFLTIQLVAYLWFHLAPRRKD